MLGWMWVGTRKVFGYLSAPQLVLTPMHLFHYRKYYDQIYSTSEQHLQSLLFVLCTDHAQHAFLLFFFPYWSFMLNLARWNELFFWCMYLSQIKLMLATALWIQDFGNCLEVADSLQDFGAVYDVWQAFRLLEECYVISISVDESGFQVSDQGAFFWIPFFYWRCPW